MWIPGLLFGLFITRGSPIAISNVVSDVNVFGNPNTASNSLSTPDSPPGCDWNPLPGNLTINRLAVHAATAVTQTCTYQMFKGIPASLTGSTVTLTSGNTDAEGAVSVTVSAPTVVADLSTQAFGWQGSAAAAAGTTREVFQYTADPPYSQYDLIGSGFATNNFFNSGGTTRYMALNVQSSSTTEADTQFAMPRAGTFKYMLCVWLNQVNNDSTYTCTLRKNAANTSITASANDSQSPNMATDTTNTASVIVGDLMDVAFVTTGTRDNTHRARVYVIIGFLAS